MTLDRELTALADQVDWPPTPDIAGRLDLEPRRASHRRRGIALLLVAAVAGAAAVPDVRAAVGDLLGIAGGERVERVSEPPGPARRLDLGTAVTLQEARRAAGFDVGVPAGRLTGVRLGGALGDRTVSLLLPSGAILSQRPGRGTIFAMKQVPPGVEVRHLTVGGADAIWIGAGPRQLIIQRPDGMETEWSAALPGAGVLLWDRPDGVVARLEVRGTVDDAVRIAESIR
jgi:hypothetical protein